MEYLYLYNVFVFDLNSNIFAKAWLNLKLVDSKEKTG